MSIESNAHAEYTCSGDPELEGYYPAWVLKELMAEDATVEGSMIDGVIVGAENVRSVVLMIKSLYSRQEFVSVGPYGEHGWIEDYVADVGGDPIGCVVLVKRDAAGKTRQVIASYRPRTSVVHFASLLAEKFAGSPLAGYFSSNEA